MINMRRKTKKLLVLFLAFALIFLTGASVSAYDIATDATTDISQSRQFLKDRNASDKMLDNLDFIYDYCKKIGIDPTIVVAISSIETGYGKSHLFVSYNNPGGIKARGGWEKFDTVEDGYRYMIRLLATYAGLINKDSWLYGKATTTQQLGNYYWVENGCDHGYHKQLTRQIKTIQSYKVKKAKTKTIKKESLELTNSKETGNKNAIDIIDNIINRKEHSHNNALRKILNRSNNHKKNGSSLDLIYNSLKK